MSAKPAQIFRLTSQSHGWLAPSESPVVRRRSAWPRIAFWVALMRHGSQTPCLLRPTLSKDRIEIETENRNQIQGLGSNTFEVAVVLLRMTLLSLTASVDAIAPQVKVKDWSWIDGGINTICAIVW